MSAATDVDLFDDLTARGLVQHATDLDALATRLRQGPLAVYYGCDPTADSLHAGNLIGLCALKRFQDAGHRPIALAGGATGMIGDPSGTSDERNLLDAEVLASNVRSIRDQMARFVDFDHPDAAAELVDNRSWTEPLGVLDFLRDPGKHVTIQQMLGKESVRARLDGETGLSYTEFSYMLLQANDYAWLAEHRDCELQIGGADQWGNISLGVDLTRRRLGRRVHGLTWPLLLQPDGSKYGKTAAGDTMWLGTHRMSPYGFYQGWIQSDDADIERLLLQLTFLSVADAGEVARVHDGDPGRRTGQRTLAREVTALVHGPEAARAAEEASSLLFGGDPTRASAEALAMVADEVGRIEVGHDELSPGVGIVDLVAGSGLAASKGEARRIAVQGGIRVNGTTVGEHDLLTSEDLLPGAMALVRRGKKQWRVVVAKKSPDRG